MTTELLRLCPTGVGDEEGAVVGDKLLLELHCAVRVDVLGVVRDERLRDRLADGVHLGGVPTTLDAHADVDDGERLLGCDEDRLVDLQAEDLGLDEVDGLAVDADETTALLGVGDSSRGLYGSLAGERKRG